MNTFRWLLIATVLLLSAVELPEHALAARPNAYPISNVNLRAGPDTDYPVIVTVPDRAPITILGCLGDHTWCDVVFQQSRGWMRSIYLTGFYQGYYYPLRDYAPRLGYPVIDFDIGHYWDANYRDRTFYDERPRWSHAREEGSVDRAIFYDRLEPYGEWVWLQGQYVWVPVNVDRQWRPYSDGHWVYTELNGWMWVSNEPFGWATYHYGRWGFSNRVGWFWVPGRRWGPAWVSWRSSDDYLAWAPLPPSYDENESREVVAETVPEYYWQVVPSERFLSVDLQRNIIRDEDRFRPILQETRPLGDVTIHNNVVVNNVVNVAYVEQKTNEKVVVHQVEKTEDATRAGKVEGAAIEVFQPAANQQSFTTAAPHKPKKVEDVAVESKTKDQAAGKPSTEDLLSPPEIRKPAGEAASSTPPPLPPEEAEAPRAIREASRRRARASRSKADPKDQRLCSRDWLRRRHSLPRRPKRRRQSGRQAEEGQERAAARRTRRTTGYAAGIGSTATTPSRGGRSAEGAIREASRRRPRASRSKADPKDQRLCSRDWLRRRHSLPRRPKRRTIREASRRRARASRSKADPKDQRLCSRDGPPPLPPEEAEAPRGNQEASRRRAREPQQGGPEGPAAMQPGGPPPPPPEEAEAPKGNQGGKQKKGKSEPQQGGPEGPAAMQPGLAPPPPLPPEEAEAPNNQGGKQKKGKSEPQQGGPEGPAAMQPGLAPPPPLPPEEAEAPNNQGGKQKKKKKGGAPCPEGTAPREDGACAPMQ